MWQKLPMILLKAYYVLDTLHGTFENLLCVQNCSLVLLQIYYVSETVHSTFESLLCVRNFPWYF